MKLENVQEVIKYKLKILCKPTSIFKNCDIMRQVRINREKLWKVLNL